MKKIAILIAAVLITAGTALFAGALIAARFDFSRLGTVQRVTNTYTPFGPIWRIEIEVSDADVFLKPSQDGRVKVVCEETNRVHYRVLGSDAVTLNTTLRIEEEDERKWYEKLTLFSAPKSVTVYLPMEQSVILPSGRCDNLLIKSSTGDVEITAPAAFGAVEVLTGTGDVTFTGRAWGLVNIKTNTGDILLNGVQAQASLLSLSTGKIQVNNASISENLGIEVSTGKAFLTDVTCGELRSKGSTGDFTLKNVVAREAFQIERETGDIQFDLCDAGRISVKTSTGDVEGSFLTSKLFYVKSATGRVEVPDTFSGGMCEITTSTGNVRISLPKEARLIVTSLPEKTFYFVGERINLKGLSVMLQFEDGTAKQVWSYGCEVDPEKFETAGEQIVTLRYAGLEEQFTVYVSEPGASRGWINSDPVKTVYTVGESLDPEGLSFLIQFDDGAYQCVTEGITVDHQVLDRPGKVTVTASCQGVEAAFEVLVREKEEQEQSLNVGDVIAFGPYEWRVLKIEGGKALLITNEIIARRTYSAAWDLSWEDSDVRKWLNNVFYEEFSETEKDRILTVTFPAIFKSPQSGIRVYPTQDKVFLISGEEAKTCFEGERDRMCRILGQTSWSGWYLRPTLEKNGLLQDCEVGPSGNIQEYSTNLAEGGIRPAIWIDLCP